MLLLLVCCSFNSGINFKPKLLIYRSCHQLNCTASLFIYFLPEYQLSAWLDIEDNTAAKHVYKSQITEFRYGDDLRLSMRN